MCFSRSFKGKNDRANEELDDTWLVLDWTASYNNGGSDVLAACMTLKLLVPRLGKLLLCICAMGKVVAILGINSSHL